jgi:microcystin-dependent protein
MSTIPVQAGVLPQGFCPNTYQDLLTGFTAQQFITLSTTASIVVSASPPADHSMAWLQLDGAGRPTRLYYYAAGHWLSLHPIPQGMIQMYNQAIDPTTFFNSFDGGSAGVITPYSGPMWQLASTALDGSGSQVMQAQFPVGVGLFPTAGVGNVVVGANNTTDTGKVGEDLHVIQPAEMALHRHYICNTDTANVTTNPFTSVANPFLAREGKDASVSTEYSLRAGTTNTEPSAGGGISSVVGSNTPHNNLPPFYGVYFFQRTNRLFYTV